MEFSINKQTVADRFKRSANTYHKEATVQRQIARHLCKLVCPYIFRPVSVLEIGCGTGFLTEEIMKNIPLTSALLNDINPEMKSFIHRFLSEKCRFVACDAEKQSFSKTFDLITSSSVIQWFNNIEKFICNTPNILSDNGIIALSSFGKENMKEIKNITGISLPYPDIRPHIESNFQILQYEEQIIKINFDSPADVLKHIKNTGVNGVQETRWGLKQLNEFKTEYIKHYQTETGVGLTYHPIYIIATKKTRI